MAVALVFPNGDIEMTTWRTSLVLVLVAMANMLGGAGCVGETDVEVELPVDDATYELQDSDTDSEAMPDSDDASDEPNAGTRTDQGGVCSPPCTKI